MALLPLFRGRTREAELEHRVYALQAALAQCKGVARSWWNMRVRFTVAVALVTVAVGEGDARAQSTPRHTCAAGTAMPQIIVDAHMWFNLAAARFPANDTRHP